MRSEVDDLLCWDRQGWKKRKLTKHVQIFSFINKCSRMLKESTGKLVIFNFNTSYSLFQPWSKHLYNTSFWRSYRSSLYQVHSFRTLDSFWRRVSPIFCGKNSWLVIHCSSCLSWSSNIESDTISVLERCQVQWRYEYFWNNLIFFTLHRN